MEAMTYGVKYTPEIAAVCFQPQETCKDIHQRLRTLIVQVKMLNSVSNRTKVKEPLSSFEVYPNTKNKFEN